MSAKLKARSSSSSASEKSRSDSRWASSPPEPRGDVWVCHRLGCHLNAGKASDRTARCMAAPPLPPRIELSSTDAVQAGRVRCRYRICAAIVWFCSAAQRRRRSPCEISNPSEWSMHLRRLVNALFYRRFGRGRVRVRVHGVSPAYLPQRLATVTGLRWPR